MTYADSLAKDRDKYRVQRAVLAKHLETMIEFASVTLAEEESHPVWDDIHAARKALDKIFPPE